MAASELVCRLGGCFEVVRIEVPGGWLYITTGIDGGSVAQTFVPDKQHGRPPVEIPVAGPPKGAA